MISTPHRLAVLGSPIEHSRSPIIHQAAYRALELDWEYSAIEVRSGGLSDFLGGVDEEWRGLSLTMPLKREILPLLDEADDVSRIVGAANTVVFDRRTLRGFNTDVFGAEQLLRKSLPGGARRAVILGGGATACSLAAALAMTGTRELVISTRSPEKAVALESVTRRWGMRISVGDSSIDVGDPDVVVSTVPGTAPLLREFASNFRASVPLIDIAYDPWPTPISEHWLEAGTDVANNGLDMLVYQALSQIRIFVANDPLLPLRDEPTVLAAMRRAAFDAP